MRSLLAILVSLSLAAPALAGTSFDITPIAVEGDSAASIARITSIDNVAVNNAGTWLVEVDTDFANTDEDGLLLRNGALDLRVANRSRRRRLDARQLRLDQP